MAEHKLYDYKGYGIYLNETIYNNNEIKVEFLAKGDNDEVGLKTSIQLLRDAIDRLTKKDFKRIPIIQEERYNEKYEKAEVTSFNLADGEYWIVRSNKQREKKSYRGKENSPIKDTPENWKIVEEITNKKKDIVKIREEISKLQETFEKVDLE